MTPNGFSRAFRFALVLLLAVAARAQVNDDWQNAIAITNGLTAGTNVGATTGSPVGNCGAMGADVWYSYAATCTGTATASTCAPGAATFDTVIATWFAPLACGTPRPVQISCNDDSCATTRSTATFAVLAGHTYYISVGGFLGAAGTFTLSVSCSTSAGPPPVNDLCANAITVNSAAALTATNVGATSSAVGDPVGSCGSMAKDVWYSFVAPQSGPYVVTTCLPGTDFDTVITVWVGITCGTLVEIGCNDDGCYLGGAAGLRSTVSFNATAGGLYHISVGGYLGATGYFNLRLRPTGLMDLAIGSANPGSTGFVILGGPANGSYFAAFTTNAGNFPNGWLLGIDISSTELISELNGGFPFWGPLDGCGHASAGPYSGLPPGLGIYGVAIGFAAGNTVPVVTSPPDSDIVQ